VTAAAWSSSDEAYLRAYQWSGSLAAGTPLPQIASPVPLGPGEVAHAHIAPVRMAGYFGGDGSYHRSFVLLGGPVGLALTGAASLAHNASKKAEAERSAIARWHDIGLGSVLVTSQRMVLLIESGAHPCSYADTGPLEWAQARAGGPAVRMQPAGMPPLLLESDWAPLMYVFVHGIVDGAPPGVPMPSGLLERAEADGRMGPG
jgi:hypothetical protein